MNQQVVTKIKLTNLSCQACQKLTAKKIQQIPGVTSVQVNLENGQAEIVGTREITLDEVNSALAGTNYQALQIS